SGVPVLVQVAGETSFPHKGKIDFTDNQVDPNTGTLRVRTTISNADHSLMPGQFAHVRLITGPSFQALVVPQRAYQYRQAPGDERPQTESFVYVVNDKNVIERRTIKPAMSYDG